MDSVDLTRRYMSSWVCGSNPSPVYADLPTDMIHHQSGISNWRGGFTQEVGIQDHPAYIVLIAAGRGRAVLDVPSSEGRALPTDMKFWTQSGGRANPEVH